MQNNYTIAVCDILGFRDLVESVPLDRVVDSAIGWFRKALYHSIQKEDFPSNIPGLSQLQDQTELGIAWLSDTIVLYTLSDSDECLECLLSTLGWLIFETIIDGSTRIRCGVSHGEAYMDHKNSIFVGKSFIEAYDLERHQAWSGGALTDSAVQRIPKPFRAGKNYNWWVIPYSVPLKNKDRTYMIDTLAINWTQGAHPSDAFLRWSKQSSEPTKEDWNTQHHLCEKWKNTRDFHDSVCQFCK